MAPPGLGAEGRCLRWPGGDANLPRPCATLILPSWYYGSQNKAFCRFFLLGKRPARKIFFPQPGRGPYRLGTATAAVPLQRITGPKGGNGAAVLAIKGLLPLCNLPPSCADVPDQPAHFFKLKNGLRG